MVQLALVLFTSTYLFAQNICRCGQKLHLTAGQETSARPVEGTNRGDGFMSACGKLLLVEEFGAVQSFTFEDYE